MNGPVLHGLSRDRIGMVPYYQEEMERKVNNSKTSTKRRATTLGIPQPT